VKNLKSITSVIKEFDFFVAEKWEIASDSQGSKKYCEYRFNNKY
ncbi:MAG: type II restriction endonuclease, partial [Candidatus Kryptoniota bacterium]